MGAGGADISGFGKWFFVDRHKRGFNKEAAAAEEQFLQQTQGMSPEDRQKASFEFEDKLGALARKRNLQGRGLEDDEQYLKEFRDREQLRMRRTAGGAMAGPNGDVGGGMQQLGDWDLRQGNLDTGVALRQGGEQVSNLANNTRGGNFDQGGYNRAQVQTAGKYGDQQGVNQGVAQLEQFAQRLYGRALTLLQTGAKDEEVAGLITQGASHDTRWGSDMGVAFEPASGYWVTRSGMPLGQAMDRQQLGQYLQTLVSNPEDILKSARDASVADAQESRKAQRERAEYGFKSMVDVFAKNPAAKSATDSLFSAKGGLKSQGWELYNTPQQMADGSTVQMAQRNGQLYRIVQMSPEADSPFAGQMRIEDQQGNDVTSTVGPAGQAFGSYMSAAQQVEAALGAEQANMIFRAESIQALMEGGMPSGGGAMGRGRPTATEGEAITDPAQIRDVLVDMGKSFGFSPSSLLRSKADNDRVGGVKNSQHMSGTAGDFPTKGKTPEQIDQFAAALTEAGFEVINEGDHLHAELPPGSEGIVASYTPQGGGEGGAGSEPAMPKKGGPKKADDVDIAQNASSELRGALDTLKQVRAVYDRFHADYPAPKQSTAYADAKFGAMPEQDPPDVAEARAEITAQLRAATAKVADLTRSTKASTSAMQKRTNKARGQAIASRYTSPSSGAAGSK